jgi:predicted DNA-binding protein
MSTVQIRVSKKAAERARVIAAMQDRQTGQVVEEALEEYVEIHLGARVEDLDRLAHIVRAGGRRPARRRRSTPA